MGRSARFCWCWALTPRWSHGFFGQTGGVVVLLCVLCTLCKPILCTPILLNVHTCASIRYYPSPPPIISYYPPTLQKHRTRNQDKRKSIACAQKDPDGVSSPPLQLNRRLVLSAVRIRPHRPARTPTGITRGARGARGLAVTRHHGKAAEYHRYRVSLSFSLSRVPARPPPPSHAPNLSLRCRPHAPAPL